MLAISPNSKVFLSLTSVDFRKQIPGLKKWIQREMKKDPFSGAYFIFLSGNRKSIKIINFDGQGMCLFWKKLSKGKFQEWKKLHDSSVNSIKLSPSAGQVMLMNGNSDQVEIQPNWKEF
jgi:transposase